MTKSFNTVVYKPDSQSTNEYIAVISDVALYKKWQEGDKTVPIAEFVDTFEIFHTGTGTQGILQRPSKQELDTVFETHNDTAVITIVLEKGTLKTGAEIKGYGSKNDAKSGGNQVSKGATGGGR
ncbi:DUF1960-domain-containing protein [Atractiella rhizophila]|nr:DUF1960-domain-containing protein [Atractiella rhizophila]KAH8930276.1 DUF1960-domain-containing protein [Atractiella rhizophila]